MPSPRIQSPEQELRFTRNGQAVSFWVLTAMLLMGGLVFLTLIPHLQENPKLPHPAWALVPWSLAWLAGRLALRCTRHAYIILTPMGMEIFPLFRPHKHLQLVMWNEIDHAETPADKPLLILHYNQERKAGVVLTLAPISRSHRELFLRAVQGRLAKHTPDEA
jgi:hypothetical protein